MSSTPYPAALPWIVVGDKTGILHTKGDQMLSGREHFSRQQKKCHERDESKRTVQRGKDTYCSKKK